MGDTQGYSESQREALKGLIAAFAARAVGQEFKFGDLGWTWGTPPNHVAALTADDIMITTQDLVDAALILAWSATNHFANAIDVNPSEVIASFGLGLAAMEAGDS
jgi:hypothetical protein